MAVQCMYTVVFYLPKELGSLIPDGCTVYTVVFYLAKELGSHVPDGCSVYKVVFYLPKELGSLVPDGCTVYTVVFYLPEELGSLVPDGELCPPDSSGEGGLLLVSEQEAVMLHGPKTWNILITNFYIFITKGSFTKKHHLFIIFQFISKLKTDHENKRKQSENEDLGKQVYSFSYWTY
jgi:hypothetical protein